MSLATRERCALAVVGALAATCIIAQVVQLPTIFDSETALNVSLATRTVKASAGAMALVVLVALCAPPRWRWLAAAGPAVGAIVVLAACVVGSGHVGSLGAAALTMAACWEIGERLVRRLGEPRLASVFVIAWSAGAAVLATVILALGLANALRWWTAGLVVVAVGSVGVARLGRMALGARARAYAEVARSRLSVACFGLICCWLAPMAIVCAAPDTGYDALAIKGWVSQLWAETGSIGAIPLHVQTAVTGSGQLLSVAGNLFGAHDTARWMQFLSVPALGATTWWWGSRYGRLGPLGGLAGVACPTLLFQAGTAYDDLLLMLGAAALAVAVLLLMSEAEKRSLGLASYAVIGLMAGSLIDLKLHVLGLATGVCVALVFAASSWPDARRRLGGILAGAIPAVALPPVARWVQYDNPVYPSYNNIFKSDMWNHVDEHFNQPFWSNAGGFDIVTWPWKALHAFNPLEEAAPPNALGFLLGAIVAAFVLGPLISRKRGTVVLWVGLVAALLFWWAQFRYARYLLPVGIVALLLTLTLVRVRSLPTKADWGATIVAGVAATVAFPPALISLTAIPDHDLPYAAAVSHWPKNAWLQTVFPERRPIADFNRLTPDGAVAVSNAYQRPWLKNGRDLVSALDVSGSSLGVGVPQTGPSIRRWLAGKGVHWLLTDGGLTREGPVWARQLVSGNARIVQADFNWILYRLTARPAPLRSVSCGSLAQGRACTVPSCPDQTVGIDLRVPAAAEPVDVTLIQTNPDPTLGKSAATVRPNTEQRVAVTGPTGTTSASIATSRPLAAGEARVFTVGARCAAP